MFADTPEADRPATEIEEIEVTPEMVEAGVEKLWDYDPQFSNERDVVEAIFRSMAGHARPSHHPARDPHSLGFPPKPL